MKNKSSAVMIKSQKRGRTGSHLSIAVNVYRQNAGPADHTDPNKGQNGKRMFETLTKYLPLFREAQFGEWIIDRENDGSPEHPMQFPYVDYSRAASDFVDEVYRFVEDNRSMDLYRYRDILNEAGIEWSADPMRNTDGSSLDGRTVMAMVLGVIRADRFCEGALLAFLEDGIISKWLSRLYGLDTDPD